LGGQPVGQGGRGSSLDHVEQPRGIGLIVNGGEIDDQRNEAHRADASGRAAVLIDADHLHSGQPIRTSRGDQVSHSAHRDRADGMPGHPELGGDSRDSGAVDHQPPQHISGTAAGRGRPRDCQRAQVLVEHRTATLWGQTAVTGHGHPQHQRIAGDRQIGLSFFARWRA